MTGSIRGRWVNFGKKESFILQISFYTLLAFFLWTIYPKGYTFSDPVLYLARAYDLDNVLKWEFDHPFDHRLGLLVSHWLSLEVFGVNTFGAYFPQVALYCVILAGVLWRVKGNTGRIYAFCVLLLLLPQTVEIFPDLGAATFMFLAVLVLERRSSARQGVLFVSLTAVAFLFKETAIFLIAPFAWAIFHDFRSRQIYCADSKRFYLSATFFGATLLFIYLLSYLVFVGDAMARFNTIDSFSARHRWIINTLSDLANRLLVAPHSFLLGYAGISVALAFLGCIIAFSSKSENQLLSIYFLSGFLLYIFFSASLSSYVPLPLMDRTIVFLIPPLAVLASDTLLCLAKRMFFKSAARNSVQVMFILIALHWSAAPIAKGLYKGPSKLHDARQRATTALMNDSNVQLLLAEGRTPNMLNVYAGFRELDQTRIHVCVSPHEIGLSDEFIVLVDVERAQFLESTYGSETCAPEMIAAARAFELTILIDEEKLFFAQQNRE